MSTCTAVRHFVVRFRLRALFFGLVLGLCAACMSSLRQPEGTRPNRFSADSKPTGSQTALRVGAEERTPGNRRHVGREPDVSRCRIIPAVPVSGGTATLIYDPGGGPLAGASAVKVRLAYNNWSGRIGKVPKSSDIPLVRNPATGIFSLVCTVPEVARVLNMAFHDTSEPVKWDNNGRSNWNFRVQRCAPPDPIPDPQPTPGKTGTAHVMMQGFYWNCPSGVWYDTIAERAGELCNMMRGYGIDRIWFPPPSKGNHRDGMGYDPYDYYDLGCYDQKGMVRTRFGTQEQLKNAIRRFKSVGIACMADIVLNHRSGGRPESNPNLGGARTFTDFSPVLSGKCAWRYNQFHPSTFEKRDSGVFNGFADVCTVTGNTPGSAEHDLIAWGRWLQDPDNAGFDGGWRFDYVKGYRPSFIAEFRAGTGNAFGMQECWSRKVSVLDDYLVYSGHTPVLDFPGQNCMRRVFSPAEGRESAPIADLLDPDRVYAARNPAKAVTFVANHDTDKGTLVHMIRKGKMLAYAFILTYQGYPCIFWKDYFDLNLADLGGKSGNGIRPLVWVRGALAGGNPAIEGLEADETDLLVYGTVTGTPKTPGYVVGINNHRAKTLHARVTTNSRTLRGEVLRSYAWYSYVPETNTPPVDIKCGSDGTLDIAVPPFGYVVYGPARMK